MNSKRRSFVCDAVAVAALFSARAKSQPAARIPRIAFVLGGARLAEMAGADPISPYTRAFIHALSETGLIEGRNVAIERRSAEGRPERMDSIMRELVERGVDVIVTAGTPGVMAAQRATDRIPIVVVVQNVLDLGVIDSLARPGRNVTGIGESSTQAKELQLLKEAAPAIRRVAVIGYRPAAGPRARWRDELDAAARALLLDLLWLGVDSAEDLDAALSTIIRERSDSLYALGTHVNFAHQRRLAEFALEQRMPSAGFAEAGMLLSYGADLVEALRRAAVYVKKILDGAKPADLPFEQPTRYYLTINMNTAKALGLTMPQPLLLRADEIIH